MRMFGQHQDDNAGIVLNWSRCRKQNSTALGLSQTCDPTPSAVMYDQLWRRRWPPDGSFICELIGRTSREEAAACVLLKLGGQLVQRGFSAS